MQDCTEDKMLELRKEFDEMFSNGNKKSVGAKFREIITKAKEKFNKPLSQSKNRQTADA